MSMFKKKRPSSNRPPFPSKKLKTKPICLQTKLSVSAVPSAIPSEQAQQPKTFPNKTIRLACWCVNGLRAIIQKRSFLTYVQKSELDIFCMNDTKLLESSVKEAKSALINYFGYQYYSCSQLKKGYAGVALLSKVEPISVNYGINMVKYDHEGRVITAEFANFFVVVVYQPNSGSGLSRLNFRVEEWDVDFRSYLTSLMETKKSIICIGNMNVVHTEYDICRRDSEICDMPGTSLTERQSFSEMLKLGLVDTFRQIHPEKMQFTYFQNDALWARKEGWRLDYVLVSKPLMPKVMESIIHDEVRCCDHNSVELVLKNSRSLSYEALE